jgi:hypothetical protein
MEDMVYETDQYTFFWNPASQWVKVYVTGRSPLDYPGGYEPDTHSGFHFDSEHNRSAFETVCEDWESGCA